MSRLGTVALSLALPAGALFGSSCDKKGATAPEPVTRSCEGMCGHGTKCLQDTCVIDWSEGVCVKPEDLICEKPQDIQPWDECPLEPEVLPPFRRMNAKKIPRFNAQKNRAQSLEGGTERWDEYGVKEQLETAMHLFEGCLTVATCYNGGYPGTGEIDIGFRLQPSGKVSSVSASASDNWEKWGVEECVRVSMYKHEFPKYDGEPMSFEYTMLLE
jgi:hypothetical protein